MSARITGPLVQHALDTCWSSIPPHVLEVQKRSLADLLCVMMAATSMDTASSGFTAFAEQFPGGETCTLIGSPMKVSPMSSALANGALCHALDFEDSHEKAIVHPNSASTPALLALAEHFGGISGKDFLAALVLASDVCCRLDLGVNEDLLKYGWNMPPIHGSMGAVLGAANLLKLDRGQTLDAIALNLSQITAPGEAAMSRSSCIRAVREAFAAEAAVKSALMARTGIPARLESPFEGERGYYHMFARDNYTPERVVEDLGSVWQSEFISFKPWPSCRATHAALGAVLETVKEHDIQPHEIENIHVVMHEIGKMTVEPHEAKYRPSSAAMAKMSLPFVLGTAAAYREVTLSSFSPERLEDEDILSVADKVTYRIDESLTKAQNKLTDVTIKTVRGEFKKHAEFPLGCVENPMSGDDMLGKFRSCARLSRKGYGEDRINRIYDAVMELDSVSDVRSLTALL